MCSLVFVAHSSNNIPSLSLCWPALVLCVLSSYVHLSVASNRHHMYLTTLSTDFFMLFSKTDKEYVYEDCMYLRHKPHATRCCAYNCMLLAGTIFRSGASLVLNCSSCRDSSSLIVNFRRAHVHFHLTNTNITNICLGYCSEYYRVASQQTSSWQADMIPNVCYVYPFKSVE